jgi:hypothetical protein
VRGGEGLSAEVAGASGGHLTHLAPWTNRELARTSRDSEAVGKEFLRARRPESGEEGGTYSGTSPGS